MAPGRSFSELVAEGARAPVDGWGFAWFDGHATEERPPWRYSRRLAERMQDADTAVDLQTGGGEVVAELPRAPRLLTATEGWPPNLALARHNLRAVGGSVVQAADAGPLPFRDNSFDLATARHPTTTPWPEIRRILAPGGTFLSQQIGPGSMRELTEALRGPQKASDSRSATRGVMQAESAGLEVIEVQEARLRTEFFDVAAVVAFLRKVVWIVPGFDRERDEERLEAVHDQIQQAGSFVAFATRWLIEARKPA